jgi:hypothetical protein
MNPIKAVLRATLLKSSDGRLKQSTLYAIVLKHSTIPEMPDLPFVKADGVVISDALRDHINRIENEKNHDTDIKHNICSSTLYGFVTVFVTDEFPGVSVCSASFVTFLLGAQIC